MSGEDEKPRCLYNSIDYKNDAEKILDPIREGLSLEELRAVLRVRLRNTSNDYGVLPNATNWRKLIAVMSALQEIDNAERG